MDSEQLRDLLEQEIEVLNQLHSLSLAKKEALLNEKVDDLAKLSGAEEQLARKFKALDERCFPQAQRVLAESSAAGPETEALKKLIGDARAIALQIRLNTQFNQALIEDSLNLIRFMLNALASPADGTYTYTAKGGMTASAGSAPNQLVNVKG